MEDLPHNRTICFIALTVVACLVLIGLIIALAIHAEAGTIATLAAALGGILTLLGALLRSWKSTSE